MGVDAGSQFELLVITNNSMQRLKNCLVEQFTINIHNDIQPYNGVFDSRFAAHVMNKSTIDFELKGKALNVEASFTEGERVEIVKRLDAYSHLE